MSLTHGFSWAKSSLTTTDLASNQILPGQPCKVFISSHSFWSLHLANSLPLKVKAVGLQPSCLVTLGEFQTGTGVRRCLCKITCRMTLGCWVLIFEARKLWGHVSFPGKNGDQSDAKKGGQISDYKSSVLWIAIWN